MLPKYHNLHGIWKSMAITPVFSLRSMLDYELVCGFHKPKLPQYPRNCQLLKLKIHDFTRLYVYSLITTYSWCLTTTIITYTLTCLLTKKIIAYLSSCFGTCTFTYVWFISCGLSLGLRFKWSLNYLILKLHKSQIFQLI